MSIIGLNALAKTATTSTQYVPVEDSNTSNTFKFLLQSLFPSMSTTGTGSQDLFISVTNSNQLNFKGLKSADTKMTVTTASNNLVLTLIESAIDLANCDNSTSAFLTAIDFAQTVSGENSVLNGGTGLSTITAGSILYASATDTLAASSAMSTNGQLLIGNATNGYPSVATLTAGSNVTVDNSAATYNINLNYAAGESWISGDASDEGIAVDAAGKVFMGQSTPTAFYSDSLNIKGGIAFDVGTAPTIAPVAATGGTTGVALTVAAAGAAAAGGVATLAGGASSGSGAGGNAVIAGGTSASGTAGSVLVKTANTTAITIDPVQNTTLGGHMIITAATDGIIHTNSGTVTQGTNATTTVEHDSTSGIITLYGAALASQAEVEFIFTNSTIQDDSVILTGLECAASGRTAGANIQVYFHTKASGSVKIVVVNTDDVSTDADDVFKINYLIINNSI